MAQFASLTTNAGGVQVDGRPLDLTPYECSVLRLLIEDAAAGQPLTALEHLDLVAPPRLPDSAPSSNCLQVIVYRIRRKLLNAGAPVSILTVRRGGYFLRATVRVGEIQRGNTDLLSEHQTLGSPA